MSSIVEPPTGINPALPSSALAMTTCPHARAEGAKRGSESLSLTSSSTALVPASMALGMTTTVLALRAEQKRTEIVVREALAKAQETCLALTAEIAALKAEIMVLKERAKATESLHIAALKAKDAQIAALLAQVKTLQLEMASHEKRIAEDKLKKASVVKAVTEAANKTPRTPLGRTHMCGGTEEFHYYVTFKWAVLTSLEDYFKVPLKYLM